MARKKLRIGPHKAKELFDLDKYPEMSVIWGIYVGDGCVTGADPLDWKAIDAHAHSNTDDEWRGWICISDARAVVTPTGKPSHTVIHELSHLINIGGGHGKKWAETVIRLGAAVEAKKFYKPRIKKLTNN